jgi:50S ribosomal protein L16 3-hydroxylase
MIRSWLTGISREVFEREHFQKAPYSEPDSAKDAIPLLTWDKVAALLTTSPGPDIILSRDGAYLGDTAPQSIEEARALFESGCSITLRNVEEYDDALMEVARAFAEEMEGEVNIHTFATPVGYRGFGWHYDCEDVFLVQTAGTKEYFLRRNTVNPEPTVDAMPKDMQFERETTPLVACTLVAGDWLYVPRGWWHTARSLDDSLAISVGILSPAAGATTR